MEGAGAVAGAGAGAATDDATGCEGGGGGGGGPLADEPFDPDRDGAGDAGLFIGLPGGFGGAD